MPRRIVGLIGNGTGPQVSTSGKCYAIIEGLRVGGVVVVTLDSGEQFVTEEDGPIPLGKPRHVSFEAKDASRELICRVSMEG